MNRFDQSTEGKQILPMESGRTCGADLDESFFWRLLGIPPCKCGEACNGCGQCKSPQV